MKRLLITGSRLGWKYDELEEILRQTYTKMSTPGSDLVRLVHGGAEGVDRQAATIWTSKGLPTESHPAIWALHGKAAGPLRNQEMVDLGADFCLGFLRGEARGTRDCLGRAQAAGIPMTTYRWKDVA